MGDTIRMKKAVILFIIISILCCSCGDAVENSFTSVITSETSTVSISKSTEQSRDSDSGKKHELGSDYTSGDVKSENSLNEQDEPTPLDDHVSLFPGEADIPPEVARVFYNGDSFTYVEYVFTDYDTHGFFSKDLTLNSFEFGVFEDASVFEDRHWDVNWQEYTVLDVDYDGKDELIYHVSSANGPFSFYIVFTVIDGHVYAYNVEDRMMGPIMTDATVVCSFGASHGIWWKFASFNADEGYTLTILASMVDAEYGAYYIGETQVTYDALLYDEYYKGQKRVSQKEFDDYLDPNISKTEVLWTTSKASDD